MSLLDELQGKVDTVQTSIATTRRTIDVVGAVAMGVGIIWALWAAFRRPKVEETKTDAAIRNP